MKMLDDRGVERVMRANADRAKVAALAGSLVLLHVIMVTLVSVTVFSLSCLGSHWVLAQVNAGDAATPGALIGALVFTVVAVAMYLRQVANKPSLIWKQVDPRLCRACGYNFGGLAVESDGCRVCPECGAAWKVPKI